MSAFARTGFVKYTCYIMYCAQECKTISVVVVVVVVVDVVVSTGRPKTLCTFVFARNSFRRLFDQHGI